MAYTTKVHGDFKPVMNFDSANYEVGVVNAVTSGVTVQPQGPKLDFFTITAASAGAFSPAQVDQIIKSVQQLATIHMYEFTTAGPDTLALAIYPTGAWTTGTLDTVIRADLTAASIANTTVASATAAFTN